MSDANSSDINGDDERLPVGSPDEGGCDADLCDFCGTLFVGEGFACSHACEGALAGMGEPVGPWDINHDSTDAATRGDYAVGWEHEPFMFSVDTSAFWAWVREAEAGDSVPAWGDVGHLWDVSA